MRATDILKNEHRTIEMVLACLEKMAIRAQRTNELDKDYADKVLEFLQNFVDGCHHAKEEQCLFPMLENVGFPRQGGPTGVLLREHGQSRKHIRAMQNVLPRAIGGEKEALQRFAFHAQAYCQMLEDHIFKEDQRLFPMADSVLPESFQQQLLDSFTHLENDLEPGFHDKYLALAHELAEHSPLGSVMVG